LFRPAIRWQFDQAIISWGTFVENRLQEIDDKGRLRYSSDEIFLTKKERIKKSVPLRLLIGSGGGLVQ